MAAASGGMPKGRRQPMAVRSGALLDAVALQVNAFAAENCAAPEVKDLSRRGFVRAGSQGLRAVPARLTTRHMSIRASRGGSTHGAPSGDHRPRGSSSGTRRLRDHRYRARDRRKRSAQCRSDFLQQHARSDRKNEILACCFGMGTQMMIQMIGDAPCNLNALSFRSARAPRERPIDDHIGYFDLIISDRGKRDGRGYGRLRIALMETPVRRLFAFALATLLSVGAAQADRLDEIRQAGIRPSGSLTPRSNRSPDSTSTTRAHSPTSWA
jgi:hypothetical protein